MQAKIKKVLSGQWSLVGSFTPEQEEKLGKFEHLLTEWNQKINLVSPNTIEELRKRHIEDSAQLASFMTGNTATYDVGSGAGLPGMILSILGQPIHLVESDMKKSIFLAEASRICGVKPTIHNKRVEEMQAQAEVITARAFAPLVEIFALTKNIATPTTQYVLLKGENAASEILEAQREWQFTHAIHPSRTGPGHILIIDKLSKKES